MFKNVPATDITFTRVRKDGTKEKLPISVVINDMAIRNQEFIVKTLDLLMDPNDLKEFLKERFSPEEYTMYSNNENSKYFNSHLEEFIEAMEKLRKFCEILLDAIRNEAPGFDIFHLLEENSSLDLLIYEVDKLPNGPSEYSSSAWWTARDMFDYLKDSGLQQGRNSIPLYKTEKKKKVVKKMDSVTKNLEYIIRKLVSKKKLVQKSIEKAKKSEAEFQEQFEEYQRYIQNKST